MGSKKNCTSYGRDAQDKIIWHANASLEVALTTRERPSCGGLLWPSKIHDFSFWSFCLETCKISQVAFTHKGMFQARKTRCPRASAKPWCANQVFRTSKTIAFFSARVDPFKDALISLTLVLSAAFSSKAAKQQSKQQSPGWAGVDKPLSLCIWVSAIPSTSVSDGTSRMSSSWDPLAMPKKKRKNWELVANRFESWNSKEIRTIGENEWMEDWKNWNDWREWVNGRLKELERLERMSEWKIERTGNGEWVNLKAWRNWFMPLVLVHSATTQLIKGLWI